MIVGGSWIWASRIWGDRIWAKVGATLATPATVTLLVEAYLPAGWTDLTTDVHSETGIRIQYGIEGNGVLDCVAGPGECLFALNNSAKTGRLLGTYSPLHANARAGWTYGAPIRVSAYDPTSALWYVLHRGKAQIIEPIAGLHGERLVHVVSYDGMYDLMNADVRELPIHTDATDAALIDAVLDAVPATDQPVARDFGAGGAQATRYAFHDLGSGEKALGLIKDLAVDEYAFVAMKGDGTFFFRNRHTRADAVSAFTFTDSNETEFIAPSSRDFVVDHVRVSTAGIRVDSTTDTVLYADEVVRSLGYGETVEFWAPFRDYTEANRSLIGGLGASLTFLANTQADGLGTDLTADITTAFYAFASVAKITLTNTSYLPAYFVDSLGMPFLQITGQAVYGTGAQTFSSPTTSTTSARALEIALRYQDDASTAQNYANFVALQRQGLTNQPQAVGFIVKTPSALMTQALAREPGDVVTVSETVTGMSSVAAVIQHKELEIREGLIVACRFGLAPASTFKNWKLGVSGRMGLGIGQTILGF